MTAREVVRTFWHGSPLSAYERTSIRSFLAQGHRVEVYAYDALEVPEGAERIDAGEVMPVSSLFAYRRGAGKGSFAAFSNVFRYKLLLDRGGIWSDLDVFCLRPFDDLPDAFAGRQEAGPLVATGLLRFPPGHALARALYEHAVARGQDIDWGQAGPMLITELLPDHPSVAVLDPHTFYPVNWRDTWRLVTPNERSFCEAASEGSYALHWWNEVLRQIGVAKDKLPPAGSWLAHVAAALGEANTPTWSEAQMATWVRNHAANAQAKPILAYRADRGEAADMLRDLAALCGSDGDAARAAELLGIAHGARPHGVFIRLRLAEALIALGRTHEAEPHLQAAIAHGPTRDEALRLRDAGMAQR